MRRLGALLVVSVVVLVGCTESSESTPDLDATVTAILATQSALNIIQKTPTPPPSPTPTATLFQIILAVPPSTPKSSPNPTSTFIPLPMPTPTPSASSISGLHPTPSPTPTQVPMLVVPTSDCSNPIESRIDGDFEGWEGDTIFKLCLLYTSPSPRDS